MVKSLEVNRQQLETVLNDAVDLTDNQASYITNIRFAVSNNEVTLDLFRVSPDPKNPNSQLVAHRLHRLILPLSLAKDIGQLLVKNLSNWEDTFGVTLPLTPRDIEVELTGENNGDE